MRLQIEILLPHDLQFQRGQVPWDKLAIGLGPHDAFVVREDDVLAVETDAVIAVRWNGVRFKQAVTAPGFRIVIADGDGQGPAPVPLGPTVRDPFAVVGLTGLLQTFCRALTPFQPVATL